MPRPFDLVVFDLGGVLVRIARSWREAHERAGLPFRPPSDPELEVRRTTQPQHDADDQGAYTRADVRRMIDAWLIMEYSGISRVFDALEAVSVDTAVLSNTNNAHWVRLYVEPPNEPEFPTLARAGHLFASHILGVEKPDPRAYRHVEGATGHAADRILFFDDTPENVEGARAVGWTAELIDFAGDTADQMLAHLRRHKVID